MSKTFGRIEFRFHICSRSSLAVLLASYPRASSYVATSTRTLSNASNTHGCVGENWTKNSRKGNSQPCPIGIETSMPIKRHLTRSISFNPCLAHLIIPLRIPWSFEYDKFEKLWICGKLYFRWNLNESCHLLNEYKKLWTSSGDLLEKLYSRWSLNGSWKFLEKIDMDHGVEIFRWIFSFIIDLRSLCNCVPILHQQWHTWIFQVCYYANFYISTLRFCG